MPANGKTNGRFQLPQLTPVNYSLTDGTDIPPPPDSPVEEKPPPPALNLESDNSAQATNGQSLAPNNANGVYEGRGRTTSHDQPPMSPASSKRASSIRRFLSRKSLHSSYSNGIDHSGSREDVTMMDRPESSLSFVDGKPGLRTKRSGSWFRRLGSGGQRSSVVYEEKKIVPMGPPPPKLPELNQLKAKIPEDDEGSLGAEDIFKNIK
jgi:hypothetical protein